MTLILLVTATAAASEHEAKGLLDRIGYSLEWVQSDIITIQVQTVIQA